MFSVKLDLSDVERAFAAAERRARSLRPMFQELVKPLRDDQKEHRKEKTGPERAWAPLSAATLLASHGKRRSASSMLGKLPTAVQYKAAATELVATSRVKWSGIHQDGGRAGHGARIPARPFLWISTKVLNVAANKIADYVARAIEGK